jgi:glycosyltransferase involved in cell wall biosynthesis
MMLGMPIVGLATTELATVVENGYSGFVGTDPASLVPLMTELLAKPAEAKRIGEEARRRALERFHIRCFVREWEEAFARVTDKGPGKKRTTGQPELDSLAAHKPEQAGAVA